MKQLQKKVEKLFNKEVNEKTLTVILAEMCKIVDEWRTPFMIDYIKKMREERLKYKKELKEYYDAQLETGTYKKSTTIV